MKVVSEGRKKQGYSETFNRVEREALEHSLH